MQVVDFITYRKAQSERRHATSFGYLIHVDNMENKESLVSSEDYFKPEKREFFKKYAHLGVRFSIEAGNEVVNPIKVATMTVEEHLELQRKREEEEREYVKERNARTEVRRHAARLRQSSAQVGARLQR